MPFLTSYSGIDVNCALQNDQFGNIPFGGIAATGVGQINVRMTVDHAVIQGGMDGVPSPSYVAGEWGEIDVEVWQNSTTHEQFLQAYNMLLAAARGGDVTNQFTSTMVIQDISTGQGHTCTGVAFMKVPDKSYQGQSQLVRWTFKALDIANE